MGSIEIPRVLILYATREGQTEKIAVRIAEHLERYGAKVQLDNARNSALTSALNLASFDLLVFGGSMHAGGIEPELVDFIKDRGEQIRQQPRSFFLVLLSAATKEPKLRKKWLADARAKIHEQLAVSFEEVEMVAGALRYSKYSAPVRWIMKRIAAKAGEATDTTKDYEYTDWQQVEAYARRMFDRLRNS